LISLNFQEGYNEGRTVSKTILPPCSTADTTKPMSSVGFALLVILLRKALIAQIPQIGLLNSGRCK